MNENQESEPLIDEDEYHHLLRNDSFLTRLGSDNFASLIEAPASLPSENDDLSHQLLQQQQPHHQLPQPLPVMFHQSSFIQDPLFIGDGLVNSDVQTESNWNNLEAIGDSDAVCSLLVPEAPAAIADGNTSTSYVPDSTPAQLVPSLQSWPGQYDFKISLPAENKDRNKWCFSALENRLFLCPNVAVPINVSLMQFIDASITITPVFKDSRHRVDPVLPCFNCKQKVPPPPNGSMDHLVRVEGQECDYKEVSERNVVSVPLHSPPPGEAVSTLLVRLICLTSCVGGPNRRPFCLVFTLHDNTGSVIGRQILDIKCCKCPSRDMLLQEKTARRNQEQSVQSRRPVENMQGVKRSAPVTTTGEKKKRFTIKLEPGSEQRYRNIPVPVEFVPQVKKYINALISENYIRHNQPNLLLFSEDEN